MAQALALAAIAGGTLMSTAGAIEQGNASRRSSNFQAEQMRRNAVQEEATAQREVLSARREAALMASKAKASAGYSAGDLGVTNIIGDIVNAGEYNAASALFSGASSASKMRLGADSSALEGRLARRAGLISSGSTLLSGAGDFGSAKSMFDKYGNGSYMANTGVAPWSGKKWRT